ncbi:tRNA preQ1(34) S-adenosylmethionine ribosyltransferase-isomerase QueA [Sabulicella glaciei]|uniref:S-adenosylmethionine:tRNA ribosyltransferase-isomerase n=1 Tax=Sabulicella glaciei TaxID=2984948 RepID=A0ABT3NSK4_9PROT|nr:tRNA preQ1(34) S-adenosylmethionine ribosyltransferase-isomerase QueA [Roseococcus sp. MDT2-1-1]MCW8085146.1 tRNA preQ1(34) S-adenosylmethionine ribosyltransferase-isomerase QueA [Roseococcus sp. MDT2-1-1]
MPLTLRDFDYDLPEALIAQQPVRPRDAARMLVVRPEAREDRGVLDLPDYLRPGDVMVVNDTRVIPARLRARRGEARIEVMLNRAEGDGTWHALIRNARRLREGDTLAIEGSAATARVVEKFEGGAARLDFGADPAALEQALAEAGEMPLPPYIRRDAPRGEDREDYQTLFAARPGAVAAPTASLHFTPRLLAAVAARGVRRATVTLHVGAGTFLPVREENLDRHRLHAEWCELPTEAAETINAARREGGRILCCGTTALRLLETAAQGVEDRRAPIPPFRGLTDIFIRPGFRFRATDLLMTNFHLPKSTLLMLVSAFAGTERMRAAYAHAIGEGYRFFSYGDASLLFRAEETA